MQQYAPEIPLNETNRNQETATRKVPEALPQLNIPDYSGLSETEQAQHRATFRIRLGLIRESFPNYLIPDFPETMSLEQIHAQYDTYVRHIHSSQDADQYKTWLILGWLVIEIVCTYFGLNIGGFTFTQMRSMNKYNRLLLELGENNYKAGATPAAAFNASWPVELRLIFVSLASAIVFIGLKMLINYVGANNAEGLFDAATSYLTGEPVNPGSALFGGPQGFQQNNQQSTQQPNVPQNPFQQAQQQQGGFNIGSLLSTFGPMLLGNNGSGLSNILGSLGNMGGQQPRPMANPHPATGFNMFGQSPNTQQGYNQQAAQGYNQQAPQGYNQPAAQSMPAYNE